MQILNYNDFLVEAKQNEYKNILYFEIFINDNDLIIKSTLNKIDKELIFNNQTDKIIDKFDEIYYLIQDRKTKKSKEFLEKLKTLSEEIILPFYNEISNCNYINIILPYTNLNICIDLLQYNDNFLFLEKPIFYSINKTNNINNNIEINSALIIADLTADPEKGCEKLSKIIDNSEYYEVNGVLPDDLLDLSKNKDALIISTHGETGNKEVDGIIIHDTKVSDADIFNLKTKLVFIDSCRQGINFDFLLTFQNKSKVKYYLSPVVSNDAGDSSTRTLLDFFKTLKEDKNTIDTLFKVKSKLFKYYSNENLNIILTLNKSFCYRLYLINL